MLNRQKFRLEKSMDLSRAFLLSFYIIMVVFAAMPWEVSRTLYHSFAQLNILSLSRLRRRRKFSDYRAPQVISSRDRMFHEKMGSIDRDNPNMDQMMHLFASVRKSDLPEMKRMW